MKYVRRLALAILTFMIGIAISPIRFYQKSISCGIQGGSKSYQSSYFMRTSRSYVYYESEAEAYAAFKKKLSEAITIYHGSQTVSKDGAPIDQHAVALFYDQGNDEYYVISFWQDGQWLHSIRSRSYSDVKELENQYLSHQ
jgi:hypothetical protein